MNDPYQTPNLTPLGQDFAEQPPKAIKVFGVIHLIFGIFGILSILGLILFIFGSGPFFNFMADQLPSEGEGASQGETLRLMGGMYQSLMPYFIFSAVVSTVLTFLILNASRALLKQRKNAVKLSKIWALAKISVVIINALVNLFYVVPKQKEFQSELGELMGMASSGVNSSAGEMTGFIFGLLAGLVIGLVYPVLSLIFLNRPIVKDFLANKTTV